MTDVLRLFVVLLRACLLPHATLAAENLALRQQLIVLNCSVKRPKLRNRDRIFWILLSRLWKQWQSSWKPVQGRAVGFNGPARQANRLLQLVNTTDTEGQTSIERSPSPRTPLPGGPTQPHLESNLLSLIHFGKPNADIYIDDRAWRFSDWRDITDGLLEEHARER